MENIKTHPNLQVLQTALESYFGVIARKKTYQNLAYLLARSVIWLIDLSVLFILGTLFLVIIAIPLWILTWLTFDAGPMGKLIGILIGGVLVIPLLALLGYPIAILEQKMASWILKTHLPVTPFWAAARSFQAGAAKYIFSVLAWKRVLFLLLRIPLGLLSFILALIVLPLTIILFSMPAAYLTGFHDLILGELRVTSFGESMVIALLALLLVPLVLHTSNLLSRFEVWLAKELLPGK